MGGRSGFCLWLYSCCAKSYGQGRVVKAGCKCSGGVVLCLETPAGRGYEAGYVRLSVHVLLPNFLEQLLAKAGQPKGLGSTGSSPPLPGRILSVHSPRWE